MQLRHIKELERNYLQDGEPCNLDHNLEENQITGPSLGRVTDILEHLSETMLELAEYKKQSK